MNRTPRRTTGLIALALCLSLAASGCGGGDDNDASNAYVSSVNDIQTELVAAYQRVASQVTSTTPAGDDGATFKKLDEALAESITKMRAVKAPEKVSKLHTELVTVLDGYEEDLAAAAEGLASGEDARVASARAKLVKDTSSLSIAFSRKINEINAKLRG